MPTPAIQERVAHVVDTRDLETIDVLGPTIQYLTSPDAGDGEPCLMRGAIPPGVVVPLHSHPDPETFLMLEGEVEGLELTRGGHRWIPVVPGDVFHVPGNARHAWRNATAQPAVMILVSTTKIGRFFREVGARAGERPAGAPSQAEIRRFLEVAERYGYWNATPEENAAIGLHLDVSPTSGA